jgi:molybdopterin biosynthesis enzyme
LVILTGGVSVGDYDHVKGVFKDLGVKTLFWRVRQKPGKPIFFGIKGKTLIFGLPGNPAAVHACFYQYVYPAIRLQMGHANAWMRKYQAAEAQVAAARAECASLIGRPWSRWAGDAGRDVLRAMDEAAKK